MCLNICFHSLLLCEWVDWLMEMNSRWSCWRTIAEEEDTLRWDELQSKVRRWKTWWKSNISVSFVHRCEESYSPDSACREQRDVWHLCDIIRPHDVSVCRHRKTEDDTFLFHTVTVSWRRRNALNRQFADSSLLWLVLMVQHQSEHTRSDLLWRIHHNKQNNG